MHSRNKLKWMKFFTVLGCILVNVPNGVFLYWGNMSTYCLSYIINVANSKNNINTPWIISAFFVFMPLGIALANFIANKIGRRRCLLIGVILSNIGMFSSYFTVQVSILALTSTLGVLLGFAVGFTNGTCLQLTVEWADTHVGRLIALVQSGFPLGAILINQFMTLLINPELHVPNMMLGRVKYFAQTEILDRVPLMFLLLGAVSVFVQGIALVMIRLKPKPDALTDDHSTFATEFNQLQDATTKNDMSQRSENISRSEAQKTSISETVEYEKPSDDYHPKEMLKTASFYSIWISYVIGDLPLLIFTNYYKFFGQMWIKNDLMLSTLGTVNIVMSGLAGVAWGVVMDKFGVKNCLAFLMSTDIIILSWYYFTPRVYDWLFFGSTLLFGCFADSLYPCFTVVTALLYGKTHFSTNFSIVLTANIVINFIAPPIIESFLSQFGFFGLFALASGSTLLSLILILLFVPKV